MKLRVKNHEFWNEIGAVWDNIIHAPTAAQYEEEIMILRTLCGDSSEFIEYINNNWLPLKHKFIKYLIDKHMHPGNATTSRNILLTYC